MHIVNDHRQLPGLCPHPPAFVPTMGALHEGHLELVRHAATGDRPVVVSVYVNPTQFAAGEDLATYPRTLEDDTERARDAGADVLFVPDTEVIYPEGVERAARAAAELELPAVATEPGLEDGCRPHFFGGVCLVVGRLFDLVRPGLAVFGEKDYQQLRVVSEMVAAERDRFGPLEIVGRPTVRDGRGLALSSRNVGIDPADADRALGLIRALEEAGNATTPEDAEARMRSTLDRHGLETQYAVVRNARTLQLVRAQESEPLRALIAARLGSIRLIDNGPLELA